MRPALCLALTACLANQPEPQPPRVVCNGSVMPVGAVLVANSTCYQLPADRCYNDPSPECEQEAQQRKAANERTAHKAYVVLGLLLAVGISLVIVAAQASP